MLKFPFLYPLNLLVIASLSAGALASNKTLKLYHDADWVNHIESAESIWRGVQVALSEVDYQVQGYTLELVKKNHSGSVLRSLRNMQAFVEDKHALAVISGIHSPPLIKNRSFINDNNILTMVPWAAGGPITRHPSADNWIFRVSVDDTKAGQVLTDYALNQKQCQQAHLLLENSAWGDSNLSAINQAFESRQRTKAKVTRFNWGIKSYSANSIVSNIISSNSDCIIFVGNAIEGKEFALALTEQNPNKTLSIISHWGITAGDFHKHVNAEQRKQLDLSFIQTCFSFMQKPLPQNAQAVLTRAQNLFPSSIDGPQSITSPAGFIHGYDATKLLLTAMESVTLSDDMQANKLQLRRALEDLPKPVEGLVKTYSKPFEPFSQNNTDAHEALGKEDLCMAYFDTDNSIRLRNGN